MGKPYSEDLRERVVTAVVIGGCLAMRRLSKLASGEHRGSFTRAV